MLRRIALALLVSAFLAAPAFAGNIPEFDTYADDDGNFFNDFVKVMVIDNNKNAAGVQINLFSDWSVSLDPLVDPPEVFTTTAAGPQPDACFTGYESYKAGPWFANSFQWDIVLQMAPETDLDLNIRDCVLKENQRNIWFYAQQTGRWRADNGMLVFAKNRNPRVTVIANAGPRQPGAPAPFVMDARKMPGLGLVELQDKLYTSKAIWEEGIVMKMPEPGTFNKLGQPVFVLREGDVLSVTIDFPFNNPVDAYYGEDNVSIKYVGILGMDITNP